MGPRSTDTPGCQSPCLSGKLEDGGDGNSVCDHSSSVATPSSVHLIGSPLVRELSDLSGSYVNGSPLPPSGKGGVPRNIFGSPRESPLTVRQPWKQAHSLSSPAPDTDGPRMPILNTSGTDDLIMVERNGVEVMSPKDVGEKTPVEMFEAGAESHERCPVIIVLMNPGFKTYELMQLWLDTETDTVRDVLQTLRQSLPSTWNQDYDGLAQFRRDRLSQLINCLRIQQFEVVPNEIWVAKPWALSADHTARYAENLLDHLKKVGVISSNSSNATDSPPRIGDTPAVDGALTLSDEAKKRIYAPDGILTHHHAIQYLSFGPPFEKPFEKPPIFPSSVAITKRHSARAPPTLSRMSPNPSNTTPEVSQDFFYQEFDIDSGIPQSRVVSPLPSSRAMSPTESFASSSKSLHFSTDESTEESQDWDDGTVKMAANLRDGSLRFSLQKFASRRESTLNRRRSSTYRRSGRFKSLRSCLGELMCASKRVKDEPAEHVGQAEEFTAHGSAYSLSFGHDDGSLAGQHLLTLFEIDEEEEMSMADMPLLGASRGYEAYRGSGYEYCA